MIALENVTIAYRLLIAGDVALVIFHVLHAVARPSDKDRRQYLILASLNLLFNVSNILLPNDYGGFPSMIEYTFAYTTGILTLFYIGYYAIKSFTLPKSRMVTVNGLALFIFGPLVFAFIVPFYLTEDLSLARQLSAIFPIPFESLLVYQATRTMFNRPRRKNAEPMNGPEYTNQWTTYIGIVAWALFPVLVLAGDYRDLEITTTNAGFHVMAVGYIYAAVRRARIEHALLQTQSVSLAQLSENQTQVMYNIAREIKAPLDLVNFYIREYVAKRAVEPSDGWAEIVTNTLHGISADIETLLALHIEGTDASPISEISSLCDNRLALFRKTAAERHIELVVAVQPGLYAKAHPREIRKVIDTLVSNALKYTDAGGHVEVNIFEDVQRIVINVQDTGKGIPAELHDRVFEIDYNLSKQRSPNDGLGMSLHLVRRILQHLSGAITLSSAPGLGTTVSASIPRAERPCDAAALPADETPIEQHYAIADRIRDQHNRFILVACGDERMLSGLCLHLEKKYNLYVARDGVEALERLHALPQVDLVIAEPHLEKIDGFDLLREISTTDFLQRIPVMFVAPQSSPTSKTKAMELGAMGYFDQMFNVDEMGQQIENLLRNVDQQKKAVLEIAFQLSRYTMPKTSADAIFMRNVRKFGLTPREIDVAKRLQTGDSYKIIADQLNLSIKTIESHVQSMFTKAQVNNKLNLVAKLNDPGPDGMNVSTTTRPRNTSSGQP